MDEFEKLFSDEFFIIDSDNLSSVESKLYGFCISNNKVIFNEDFNKKDFSLRGSFVYVDKVDDTISSK